MGSHVDRVIERIEEGIWNAVLHPRGRGGRFKEILRAANEGTLIGGVGWSHGYSRDVGDLHAAGLLSRRFDTGNESFNYDITEKGREALGRGRVRAPRSGRSKYGGVVAERVSYTSAMPLDHPHHAAVMRGDAEIERRRRG